MRWIHTSCCMKYSPISSIRHHHNTSLITKKNGHTHIFCPGSRIWIVEISPWLLVSSSSSSSPLLGPGAVTALTRSLQDIWYPRNSPLMLLVSGARQEIFIEFELRQTRRNYLTNSQKHFKCQFRSQTRTLK